MSENIKVSSSPHVRSKMSTSRIMFFVIISLLPATLYGIIQFGFNSALLVAVCIGTCGVCELVYEKLMKLEKEGEVQISATKAILLGWNLNELFGEAADERHDQQ